MPAAYSTRPRLRVSHGGAIGGVGGKGGLARDALWQQLIRAARPHRLINFASATAPGTIATAAANGDRQHRRHLVSARALARRGTSAPRQHRHAVGDHRAGGLTRAAPNAILSGNNLYWRHDLAAATATHEYQNQHPQRQRDQSGATSTYSVMSGTAA
jgi:hypothetical protein